MISSVRCSAVNGSWHWPDNDVWSHDGRNVVRALMPVTSGRIVLEGFEVGYEVYGDESSPAVLLLPTWQIVHSGVYKMQIPFLARHFRVVSFDPPGNGASTRSLDPRAYEYDRLVDQAVGLLDHLGIASAQVIGFSRGADYGIALAARYPERVDRLLLIAQGVTDVWQPQPNPDFWKPRDSYEGWEKRNIHYWHEHWDDWLEFFFNQIFNMPHSTKAIEDSIAWANETTPDVLALSVPNRELFPGTPAAEAVASIRCPVLIIHGDRDQCDPISSSHALIQARPDWGLITIEGGGHGIPAREPVRVNLEIARFFDAEQPTRRAWRRAAARNAPRALFVSSPIGLGHVQRDLAIARELRRLVPGLHVEWLAQSPVTTVLERAGESIHPLSAALANESAHWEAEAALSGEHRMNCFLAFREMDEILLTNFMLFLEATRDGAYDLWIGDEAWEVDYYLHENPELKTAPYTFLTDFLGWLPIDTSPGSREAFLTGDYNAEMIEQVSRARRVRDRALYIGDYDDLVPERFGPDLPFIPDWTRTHFDAVGYITPFDPAAYRDTRALRQRLGYDPDAPLIVAAVGGTTIGRHLLAKVVDAWPLIQRERPDARCVVVAGPRLAPDSLPQLTGIDVQPYVHNLYEHLAAADLGIVQGGLSTTMELTVTRRPFLYFPLRDHCEQEIHVAHRLDRYRAGRRMDYDTTTPESLADAALATLGADTSGYREYEPGGATRAAQRIAELL